MPIDVLNKISDLPANAALDDADLLELEQPGETAGTRSRKLTLAGLLAWVQSGLSGFVTSVNGASGAVVLELDDVTIVTEASAATIDPATHAGLRKYIRAAGDLTFDSTEGYAAGEVYNIRATAAIDLLESGVTLTPPSGGTLALDADMSVTVVMTSGTAGDVIGQTVPA